MSLEHPDHRDAEIVIRLYDLRREAVMRESRNAIAARFWPRNFEDVAAVIKPDHPLNAALRQTSSYWEMVFGMGHHGIVQAEYLVENCGEGLFLFAKVAPYLARIRKEISPLSFVHAEWAANQTESGRLRFDSFRNRVADYLAANPA